MKPTKLMTLVGWAVSATTAGYLLPQFVINAGGAIPISPWNIIVTLPLIGLILLLMAIPMFKYRKANNLRAKDSTKPRPMPMNPFYAVRLYPGDIGAATGLLTDAHARAIDGYGHIIAGLYACGNDMHSIMGGTYPGPGITIGPGLTFGYLAAEHAVERARQS